MRLRRAARRLRRGTNGRDPRACPIEQARRTAAGSNRRDPRACPIEQARRTAAGSNGRDVRSGPGKPACRQAPLGGTVAACASTHPVQARPIEEARRLRRGTNGRDPRACPWPNRRDVRSGLGKPAGRQAGGFNDKDPMQAQTCFHKWKHGTGPSTTRPRHPPAQRGGSTAMPSPAKDTPDQGEAMASSAPAGARTSRAA
jgi:hypothetical protein